MPQRGYNTNLASEFHVMSVLYRLGLDAHLTLGNKKSVDIAVIAGPGQVSTIDVKAVAKRNDWLVGRQDAKARPNHFVALVCYHGHFDDPGTLPDIWLVPHGAFLPLVIASSGKTAHYVRHSAVRDDMGRFKNNWTPLLKYAG